VPEAVNRGQFGADLGAHGATVVHVVYRAIGDLPASRGIEMLGRWVASCNGLEPLPVGVLDRSEAQDELHRRIG